MSLSMNIAFKKKKKKYNVKSLIFFFSSFFFFFFLTSNFFSDCTGIFSFNLEADICNRTFGPLLLHTDKRSVVPELHKYF